MTDAKQRRRGWTLIELLTAGTCLAVLLALVLPAVNAARSDARSSSCKNYLKMFGLALHNYHDVYGTFPPGWVAGHPLPNSGPRFGWMTSILPFEEEMRLYDLIDTNKPLPAAQGIFLRSIPFYRCPADPTPSTNALRGGYGTSNYSGNYGTLTTFDNGEPLTHWLSPRRAQFWPGQAQPQRRPNGMFGWNSSVKFRDIIDGSSNTFLVGERSAKSGAGIWPGVGDNTQFNDALTDCSPGNDINKRFTAFSSYHEGGAHFLFCDGAVRFLSENINSGDPGGKPGIYQALSTRNGGEVVGEF